MFRTFQVVSLLALLASASGCATHALWNEADLDTWNEPAPTPNLRLFRNETKNDFLVVYNEYRERKDAVRTKAFLLNANQTRLDNRQRPNFVSAKNQRELSSVLVVPPNSQHLSMTPQTYYAVADTNGSFKIFSGEAEISSHSLPVYNDGFGGAKRVALTPVAVVGDLTIIGGWICLWYWSIGGLSDVH